MRRIELEDVMIEGSTYSRGNLKKRLLEEGIFKNECTLCDVGGTWNGKPINHRLDHINGINNDHRLSNLRMVCPNCDSQLDTFCGRNKKAVEKKKYYCGDCGKDKSATGVNCRSCASKRRNAEKPQYRIKWPSVAVLLEMVEETSYSETGRVLGVSGNAIRKRIKKHAG